MGNSPSVNQLNPITGECESVKILGTNLTSGDKNCCAAGAYFLPVVEYSSPGILVAELLFLCYIFLGVALGADVFMTSIDVITSKEKTKMVNGHPMHFRIWNPTIANLTLMALGSSAPEILLSFLEVISEGMATGALGPSTIVGSAAFNLMVITAVCIVSLDPGDTRTLKQLGVFLTTAFFSLFAYVWLLIMVTVWTPEVVTVEEGSLTVVWMVLLLILAFLADKYWDKMTRGRSAKGGLTKAEAAKAISDAGLDGSASEAEIQKVLELAASELAPKSRAYYMRQANKAYMQTSAVGGGKIVPSEMTSVAVDPASKLEEMVKDHNGNKSRSAGASPPAFDAMSAGIIRWEQDLVKVFENCGKCTVVVTRLGGTKGEVSVEYKTKDQSAKGGKDFDHIEGELKWEDGDDKPKKLDIVIHDDDEFEKDEHFTVVLSEPKGGVVFDKNTDGGDENEVCTVVILNDDNKAAKLASAMKLLRLDSDALELSGQDWCQQIKDVFQLPDGGAFPKFMHFATLPWKFLFNVFVAPPALCGGWPCFGLALGAIGFQVMLISDFATQMGCLMGLPDTITAITFVALGTSLPDTFASMQAARGDKYADNSIGNVTGSNSVNVFFGLGLPWLMGSLYWAIKGLDAGWDAKYGPAGMNWKYYDEYKGNANRGFYVSSDGLGASVVVFTIFAIVTLCVILLRRHYLNAELGGDPKTAKLHAAFLVSLWFVYILMSILLEPSTGPILTWTV